MRVPKRENVVLIVYLAEKALLWVEVMILGMLIALGQ